jgi:hypothetical protein
MSSKTPRELTGRDEDLIQPNTDEGEARLMQARARSLVQRTLDEAKARAYGLDRKPKKPGNPKA